jgi:hypothetical protein
MLNAAMPSVAHFYVVLIVAMLTVVMLAVIVLSVFA